MEDNGNMIVKVLAIVLIAILGINVYRTEKTNRVVLTISEKVDSLNMRLDSLEQIKTPNAGPSFKTMNKKVADISKTVARLESKVEKLSSSKQPAATAPKAAVSSTPTSKPSNTAPAGGTKGRVAVSAKAKVENRYVEREIVLPKITTGPTGIVVINVSVDMIGKVVAVSVNSKSTITDEEILDECKDAALRTRFSYNTDVLSNVMGTITYSFSAK